ncbi:hypothetical protein XI25_05980 [Paenibacillus sp. DMB20]|nr:hypothetical protein XI25_05980 [Paenibacillus sp. DMB20]
MGLFMFIMFFKVHFNPFVFVLQAITGKPAKSQIRFKMHISISYKGQPNLITMTLQAPRGCPGKAAAAVGTKITIKGRDP